MARRHRAMPAGLDKDGKVFLVRGSPGGSRIITTVLEAILDIVDYGMAPRLHFQGEPDALYYKRFGLSPDTATLLSGMGYKLVEQKPCGACELTESAGGRLCGANDSRRPAGAALGY